MSKGVAESRSDAAGPSAVQTAIVLDDQEDIGALVVSQLAGLGIPARAMTSKLELVQALEARHPDLLLLDLSLGESDALEIFGLLHERAFRGRVVLISGHAGTVLEHARRIGERAGVEIAGTLRKPFRHGELKRVVAGLRGTARRAGPSAAPPAEPGLLRAALAKGWLEIWYQLKIDLRTARVAGVEALARVRHPERGVIPPAAFLPPADDRDLFDLTIEAARCALATVVRAGGPIAASVNVAGRTLLRPGLLEALRELGDGAPSRLILEMTETDLIGDIAAASTFATRAVLHGFRISIDDFGTGYATFERLRQFPFAELKIERAIVHGCARDPALRRICRAAVELAHGFEAEVVAEGIESPEDLEAVRELGFDLAQGYLFARPMPAEAILAYLATPALAALGPPGPAR